MSTRDLAMIMFGAASIWLAFGVGWLTAWLEDWWERRR